MLPRASRWIQWYATKIFFKWPPCETLHPAPAPSPRPATNHKLYFESKSPPRCRLRAAPKRITHILLWVLRSTVGPRCTRTYFPPRRNLPRAGPYRFPPGTCHAWTEHSEYIYQVVLYNKLAHVRLSRYPQCQFNVELYSQFSRRDHPSRTEPPSTAPARAYPVARPLPARKASGRPSATFRDRPWPQLRREGCLSVSRTPIPLSLFLKCLPPWLRGTVQKARRGILQELLSHRRGC